MRAGIRILCPEKLFNEAFHLGRRTIRTGLQRASACDAFCHPVKNPGFFFYFPSEGYRILYHGPWRVFKLSQYNRDRCHCKCIRPEFRYPKAELFKWGIVPSLGPSLRDQFKVNGYDQFLGIITHWSRTSSKNTRSCAACWSIIIKPFFVSASM